MHSYVNEKLGLDNCRFFSILLAQEAFHEIPGLLWANTKSGSREFIFYGTCLFSLEYLVKMARMFPNFQGLVVLYENGCGTLGDRMVRLRGHRDRHISRLKGGEIEGNSMARFLNFYKDILKAGG